MRIVSTGELGLGTTLPATLVHVNLSDATTDAIANILTVAHTSSGTPAAGFGSGQVFTLKSSTTTEQAAARIAVSWTDATHATRKADLILSAYDTAEREAIRIRGTGSAAAIGFLGATPSARIAHVTDASVTYGAGDLDTEAEVISAINTTNGKLNSILSVLETFGFVATA